MVSFRAKIRVIPNVSYERALICTIKYICYEYSLTNNKTHLNCVEKHSKSRNNTKLQLYGKKLTSYKEVKFLGVIFDQKLTFKKHMEIKSKEIQGTLHNIYKLKGKNYGPIQKTILQIYKTFIRSNFEYGNIALITSSDTTLFNWEKNSKLTMQICNTCP